jgi:hypothetical protein
MAENEEYIEKESVDDLIKSVFVVCLGKVRSVNEKIVSKPKNRWTLPRRRCEDGSEKETQSSLL